jgi:formate dehydrogenase subunit gamma
MPIFRHDSLAAPRFFRAIAAVLMPMLMLVLIALTAMRPALAAVPHESAVPAYAEEQTILQTQKDQPEPGWSSTASGRQHFDRHFIVPFGLMPEQDVILQRGGNTWRHLRNGPLAMLTGTLLLVVPLLLWAVWRFVGPSDAPTPSGRTVVRFGAGQRFFHWATAISFIVLALSGLIMLFGKKLLLPWMGHDAFSWLAVISKYAHNFIGPLFILCSIGLFLAFLRHNVFRRWDWQWIREAGGLLSRKPAPAGYFNAGQKLWFWVGLTGLGLLMSVTGLVLNFPYFGEVGSSIGTTRYVLQWANVLHLLGASIYIAATMGHIYLGTAHTPGAYSAMRHGTVDEAWVREHHPIWYEQLTGRLREEPARTDGPSPRAPNAPGLRPNQ